MQLKRTPLASSPEIKHVSSFGSQLPKPVDRPGFRPEFPDRLAAPDWAVIQQGLGRPVPKVLRELYSDPQHVLHGHFQVDIPNGWLDMEMRTEAWIDVFLPADQEAIKPRGMPIPRGAFAFAETEYGDPYLLIPETSADDDGPVYVLQAHHGGGALTKVADSLRAFLTLPRRYAP